MSRLGAFFGCDYEGRGCRLGNEVSIEEFVATRGQALVRFAFALCAGDAHRAEDLVQAALAKVLRRWDRICSGGQPEAYLRRVIVTEHVSWRRRRSSTETPVAGLPDRITGDVYAAVDAQDAAWRLLSELPPRQRAVLVLRYLEDWPDAAIAQALGCSEVTVRSQAARGLHKLRDRLGEGWTVPVGSDGHA
jgi:RNA polymerase sigma-70 factor (sigma-E family)